MAPIMSIAGLGGPTPSFARGGGQASFSWKYHINEIFNKIKKFRSSKQS